MSMVSWKDFKQMTERPDGLSDGSVRGGSMRNPPQRVGTGQGPLETEGRGRILDLRYPEATVSGHPVQLVGS